jgi:hypothetical protein
LISPIEQAPIVALAILLPVQGSALTATLVRKGKIASYTGGVLYVGLLLLAFMHFPWRAIDLVYITVACVCRFRLRLNKYLLWCMLVGIAGSSAVLPNLPAEYLEYVSFPPSFGHFWTAWLTSS